MVHLSHIMQCVYKLRNAAVKWPPLGTLVGYEFCQVDSASKAARVLGRRFAGYGFKSRPGPKIISPFVSSLNLVRSLWQFIPTNLYKTVTLPKVSVTLCQVSVTLRQESVTLRQVAVTLRQVSVTLYETSI